MSVVTEKEAVEKWCPFARSFESGGVVPTSYNRIHVAKAGDKSVALSVSSMCIGADCMAWKWHKTNVKVANLSQYDRDEHGTAIAAFSDTDIVASWRTYGFCGAFRRDE